MIVKLEVESLEDIHLIICALSVYHVQTHPDNSCKKDIRRLIETFLKLNKGDE